MKKQLLILAGCLSMAGLALGANETLTLTSGGFNTLTVGSGTGSFTLDAGSSWTGYSSVGLSYWLQVPTASAGSFSLSNVTYGSTFPDGNQLSPSTVPFNDATAADGAASGFTIETRDLGSTENAGAVAAGTYADSSMTVNFSGLAPGSYIIKSTNSGSRPSEQSDDSFAGHNFPVASFTLTVVPEPATWSLLGLGGLGSLGLTMLRARRRNS